jgi:lanosterol synthase
MIAEKTIKKVLKQEEYWDCWRLETQNGRQRWFFDFPNWVKTEDEQEEFIKNMTDSFSFDKEQNPNSSDQVLRYILEKKHPSKKTNSSSQLEEALNRGFDYYSRLQMKDGNWAGDYGGPHFLTPGLIIVSYIIGHEFSIEKRGLVKKYMLNHQNSDGGWGLHIEDHSTMFGTVMQYLSLRILGMEKDHPSIVKARDFIKKHGGATGIPPWGKFYLSILNLYEWEGNNSIFPELWVLPRKLPLHPGKYWNHARMVYLPMTYCYSKRLKIDANDFISELRKELYVEPYENINWKKARNECTEVDIFKPASSFYKTFVKLANVYEKIHLKAFRKKADQFILDYIHAEDEHTNHINIGPVNKVLNALCVWHAEGTDSQNLKKHIDRFEDYLWLAEDGIKMNGYNGSQLWDTVFAGQALIESGKVDEFPEMSNKIYNFLDVSQVQEDVRDRKKFFRTISKHGWPFSTRDHGWPITDCTAEGLKTSILLNQFSVIDNKTITEDRMPGAIDFLLQMQNPDGSWASYEEKRGPKWMELLNPSQIFGDIMVEVGYVECTSASIQGLQKYVSQYNYRKEEVKEAIDKGKRFIKSLQKEDGSWYGSWAVCFTYGTWFGIDGLVNCGESTDSLEIQKAVSFLLSKQNKNGSWGEEFKSCVEAKYYNIEEGHCVNTAWALMALLKADCQNNEAIQKGIEFLIAKQDEKGDWPQENISGVFNGNCMISYTSYRNVFPLWALGRYYSKIK